MRTSLSPSYEITATIPQKLLTITGVSPLCFDDEKIFREMFPKDIQKYACSFLYFLRASHRDDGALGYKYVDSNLVAVIGYRKKRIYITPLLDLSGGEILQRLCKKISAITRSQIFLKKFSSDLYPKLENFTHTIRQEKELEDDTCPETILNLQKIFSEQGEILPIAKRFRQKVKRFEKFQLEVHAIERIEQIPIIEIEQFLNKDEEKYASYMPIVTYLYEQRDTDEYRIVVFRYGNSIKGIYIAELLSPTKAGLYCSVNAKDKPGSTEWMDWYFFRKMHLEGIKTIYFGGAENTGVDYYIKKLLPDKPDYSVTMVEYSE